MRKFRNFKCQTCLKVVERMVKDDVKTILCECGGVCTRQLSAPKCFQNTVGKSPSVK